PPEATLRGRGPRSSDLMYRSSHARSITRARLCVLLPAALLLLAACSRDASAPGELPGAGSEPAGAVRQLAGHLQDNDLVAFARDALPPDTHAALEIGRA